MQMCTFRLRLAGRLRPGYEGAQQVQVPTEDRMADDWNSTLAVTVHLISDAGYDAYVLSTRPLSLSANTRIRWQPEISTYIRR